MKKLMCFTSTRCQLPKTSVIAFNAAKQKELNSAVVYNTVIHEKPTLSSLTLLGSFKIVAAGDDP